MSSRKWISFGVVATLCFVASALRAGTPRANAHNLTVEEGAGSGGYYAGTAVSITAGDPDTGMVFWKWTGAVTNVADAWSAATTVTMPDTDITVTATYVDEADAGKWSPFGGGFATSGVDDTAPAPGVRVFARDNAGKLYAGGSFIQPGAGVATWRDGAWRAVGSGVANAAGNSSVNAMVCDSAGNLYVGGDFAAAGGKTASNVAKWDATAQTWSALGDGLDYVVNTLALDTSGVLYAGGANGVSKWDAKSWTSVSTANCQTLVCVGSNVFASFHDAATASYHLNKWDGAAWNKLGAGGQSMAYDPVGGRLVIGLYQGSEEDGLEQGTVSTYDLTSGRFQTLGGVTFENHVYAVCVDTVGDIYAAGTSGNVSKWNGKDWITLTGDFDEDVYCMTSLDGKLYAAGDFTYVNGYEASGVAVRSKFNVVNFVAGPGGSITGARTQWIEDGGACADVTAVPDSSTTFLGWYQDGVEISSEPTLTEITDVEGPATYHAIFSNGKLMNLKFSQTFSQKLLTYSADGEKSREPYDAWNWTCSGAISGDFSQIDADSEIVFTLGSFDSSTLVGATVGEMQAYCVDKTSGAAKVGNGKGSVQCNFFYTYSPNEDSDKEVAAKTGSFKLTWDKKKLTIAVSFKSDLKEYKWGATAEPCPIDPIPVPDDEVYPFTQTGSEAYQLTCGGNLYVGAVDYTGPVKNKTVYFKDNDETFDLPSSKFGLQKIKK